MFGTQSGDVEPDRQAVHDAPVTLDHHPVRACRPAQDERGDRIVGAGKAQLVQGEEGEIGLKPDRDATDVGSIVSRAVIAVADR